MWIFSLFIMCATIITQMCSAQEPTLPLRGISFFSPRAQSTNAAREIAGVHPHQDKYDMDKTYGYCAFTTAYNQSVRPNRIAEALFGTDTLSISGSLVTNRNELDILADFFGLSTTFNSCVELIPRIQSALVIFDSYLGLDSVAKGLFLELHIPVGWTNWKMELRENVVNNGEEIPFPARYMNINALTAPITQFKDAFSGDVRFGQMQDPLKFGKIDNCGQSKGGIADVHFALGWNFILRENGHVGLSFRVAAPTGSRPKSEFFFEPIIGNGKHWEFGLGFNGRVVVWEKDGNQQLAFHAITHVMHLFKARQKRSFDLKNIGFFSRYMLAKLFDENGNYTGNLTPVINHTTLSCDVDIDIQADIVFMFGYTYNELVFDIGYNGWIRSKENICLKECVPKRRLGLKGIQNVITGGNELSNATQSNATILGNPFDQQGMLVDLNSPMFISTDDICEKSAASPRLVTHKVFTHIGYAWIEKPEIPFIGVGAEIEFEGINTRNTKKPERNTLAQWGIWFKTGVAF